MTELYSDSETPSSADGEAQSHPVPVDRISELYQGELRSAEASNIARERIHWMCSRAQGETIVDIGCSQGIAAILLAREGFTVTGLDAHPDAIAYATSASGRETAAVAERLTWIQRDLYELPGEQQFDTVLMGEVIEHQAVPSRFLAAASQHLRSGGTLVLTTPFGVHPHEDHKVSLLPRDVVRMAEAVGLTVTEIDVVDGYIRMVARNEPGTQRSEEDLLKVTAAGTLGAQERYYALMAKRAAALEARRKEIAKHTATIATLKTGADSRKKAIAHLNTQLEEAKRLFADASAANEHAQGEVTKAQSATKDLTIQLEAAREELRKMREASEVISCELEAERATIKRIEAEVAEARTLAQNEKRNALAQQRELEAERATIKRIEAEVAEARTLAQREKRNALAQQRAHQRALAVYERQTVALKHTLAFQLGEILVRGFKSPRALAKLPGELIAFQRANAKLRGGRGNTLVPKLGGKGYPRLIERLNAEGYDAAVAMVEELVLNPATRANVYTALSRHLRSSDPVRSAAAARIAYEADPKPWRAKWLAFRLYDAGALVEPSRLLRELPQDQALSGSEETRSVQIHALADLFEIPPDLPFTAAPRYKPKPKSLLYVAASAPPYHISGYTMRTAALLRALKQSGVELSVATRPGYPWDRHDSTRAATANSSVVDGITYHHFRHPAQNLPLDVYIEDAATAIARLATDNRVSAIHAASNHVNALPALIAARKIGAPFHYEVRGLWEMSRASNVEGFEESERYRLGLDLEAFVARNADRIYAISDPLADFLVNEWGIERDRVAVLPNAVDRATFAAIEAAVPARFTIGYAGALVGYEGLDLLLEAVAQIRAEGHDVAVQLIGDGTALEALKDQARTLKIERAIEFAGKLSPEAARARLATSSLICLPRRPDKVCELVPPIKLVEAMALGVPLIVPDLAAFRAEVEDGVTARFFKAGDVADLARAIGASMADPQSGQSMATTARARALDQRDWSAGAQTILRDIVSAAARARLAARSEHVPLHKAESFATLLLDSERMATLHKKHGIAPFIAMIDSERRLAGKARALELLKAGQALCDAGLDDAEVAMAEEALNTDRSVGVLIGIYRAFERAGEFDRTGTILAELERHPDVVDNPSQQARIDKLKSGFAYHLELLKLIEPRREAAFEPVGNRICYMLHNSLPYSSGGYATRSHGVATGLSDCGFEVIAMTRPGFPHDVVPDLEDKAVATADEIDGIAYRRIFEPRRKAMKYVDYVPNAASELEEQYRELRPSLVISASNHVVALPTLIACRRLGIPFVYEVRGFWEVTKMSREHGYASTAAYKSQSLLEAAVCREADHVFTLTQQMREELAERGIPSGHVDLLPNSCDPERFLPRERDTDLLAELGIPHGTPVIGYIGTFVDYEGLDDLARACGVLKERGKEFRLLLVGNENTSGNDKGPITEMIATAATEGGFADWLIMPGRVPHEVVGRYYSLLDICPFPRKPWPVCEMVSPMKPLEALAMEKTVIVSSVRALSEMIADDSTGLVFEKGNIEALADVLERAMGSSELRERLGRTGRQWVIEERTWRAVGHKASELLAPFVTPARVMEEQADPSADLPAWWSSLPNGFRRRAKHVPIVQWQVSKETAELKARYIENFGEAAVQKRMPEANWKRADICAGLVPKDRPLLDIGSGLGEFVNLFCTNNPSTPLTSVDVKDYDLWKDMTGRIERVYKSIFDLGPDHARDVVTCFEVIEHLPPAMVADAVAKLRSLAKHKLFVSVPFLEPLPLYRGHFTRFDPDLLEKLFPDAKLTVFDKGSKNGEKVLAWILCEIDMD